MTVTDELNAWIAEHGSCRDALNVALARLRHLRAALIDLECENADLWNEKFERDEVRVVDLDSSQMALLWKRAAKHWRKRFVSETQQLIRYAARIAKARDGAREERDEALARLALVQQALEEVEWVWHENDEWGLVWGECPWCHQEKPDGHSPDCLRQKALNHG